MVVEFYGLGTVCLHASGEGRLFVISLTALKLSNVLSIIAEKLPLEPISIDDDKCSETSLSNLVRYLDHHNGVQPAKIAKPIRSVRMSKLVEDEWE